MGVWRRAWADGQRSLPRPLRVSETRYHVIGPEVVERRGLDEHWPVRPPEKWKRVRILGGTVYINGHESVKWLRECPHCASLVVDDAWAKETHQKACHPIDGAVVELGESTELAEDDEEE